MIEETKIGTFAMPNRPLILIVEDDAEIAELLEENLRAPGFDTVAASNGVELFSLLEARKPDLILLDIMLPGEDGLTLCRRLRAGEGGVPETPIIFLSALGDLTDRVVGLELGADDYLPKPFEMRELLARIRAVLRRSEMRHRAEAQNQTAAGAFESALPARTVLRFGPWRVDMGARHLIDEADVTVSLSAQEFKLLEMFLKNPQRVLTRESILLKLENRTDAYDRNIDVQMSRLRAKLRDSGRNPKHIRTMRGDGYMLAVPVEKEVP